MNIEYRELPTHKRFINRVGEKHGKLVIIKYIGYANGNSNQPVWLCLCECGKEKITRYRSLVNGFVTTCGQCPKPVGNQHPEWEGAGEISKSIWHQYRLGALARGIKFDVTVEQLWELFEKQKRKCTLTGWELYFPPSLKDNKNRTASLDRINSKHGYEIDNLQWVHRDVNKLKKNMDDQRFIELCLAVAAHKKYLTSLLIYDNLDLRRIR